MTELKPYDYQETGIAYALKHLRVILGDDVGCGKTVQAIMAVKRANLFPCLVVCPATLKINWQREWAMWSPEQRTMILTDTFKYSWMDHTGIRRSMYGEKYNYNVVICNYESLKKYFTRDGIVKGKRVTEINFHPEILGFKSIIIDEIHRCKDSSTQNARLTKGLSIGKKMILGLTGTPVVNKPDDIIAQLGIIDRLNDFGGVAYFKNTYSAGENNEQLYNSLKETCYIRREKSDVLKELPDKVKTKLYVDITNRPLYNLAQEDIKQFILEQEGRKITNNKRAQLMVKIIKLRQLAALGKIKYAKDYIDNITKNIGKKIIVFVWHIEIVTALIALYPKAVKIVGEQQPYEKQLSIDKFQKDPDTKIIICNIKAAGVGITLTAASVQLFLEFPWTSADMVQCEGRAYRNGQKDSVNCVYLMGKGTIDNWMFDKTETKRVMSNEISGSKENGVDEIKNQNDLITALMQGEIFSLS